MFEIFQSEKNGKYYFRLKAANGEIVLTSQAYADKASCEKGVASVQSNAANRQNFEESQSTDGKTFFNLKASNGQVIGTSQMYASKEGMNKGIESVINNGGSQDVHFVA
ncbi:MAG: YegP family protein [Planctomycetales bacterium]|nr:YegP family protein [Planctomycetales bacterium]